MTDPRNAYREAAVRGANPVQLVIRLYEQVIEDLRQALKAIEQNQIDLRTNKINHAIVVIGHLQGCLNFEAGGKPARDLNQFYDVLRQNLLQAQIRASKQILSQQITDLLEVRAAWMEVERRESPSASLEAVTATTATGNSTLRGAGQRV